MDKKNTKERILLEAIRLFGTQGFEVVSIRQIADAVGIKGGSIYSHFESKSDIWDSVLQLFEERMQSRRLQVWEAKRLAESQPVSHVLTRLNYARTLEGDEIMVYLFRILFAEQFIDSQVAAYFNRVVISEQVEEMTEVFTYMMHLGKIPPRDPHVLATMWADSIVMTIMKASHHMQEPELIREENDHIEEFLMEFICGGAQNAIAL